MQAFSDPTALLQMPRMMPLIDVFQSERRVGIARQCLLSFVRSNVTVSDQLTIHFLMENARAVRSSVDSLSNDDVRRESIQLVSQFIKLVKYPMSETGMEKQLEFLTTCRRAFADMDEITEMIIQNMTDLVMEVHSVCGCCL